MEYLLLILQSALSVFGIRSAYEQPKYEVVGRLGGGVEVRQYAPRLAAETTVSAADEARGRDDAFRLLAAYIFGANGPAPSRGTAGGGRKVAMTTPVQVAPGAGRGGDKVAMTTPVQVDRAAGGFTMRFFLPARLTADTAPAPRDGRVKIVTVPAETVAVVRFNGSWDPRNIGGKKQALLRSLENGAWRAAGEPYTLFYDPPFTIPLFRRNEVAIPVERREGGSNSAPTRN